MKIKFNPFSAMSLLFAALTAMLFVPEKDEEISFEADYKAKDKNALELWKEKEMFKNGFSRVTDPYILHAICNDEWQKDQTDDVSLAFVAAYKDLDVKKVEEIRKKYLVNNEDMHSLATKGRLLKSHPFHSFFVENGVDIFSQLGENENIAADSPPSDPAS